MKLRILVLALSSIMAPIPASSNLHTNDTNRNNKILLSGNGIDVPKITFRLFTKIHNEQGKSITADDPDLLSQEGFEPAFKTLIFIHGWLSNSQPTYSFFHLKDIIFQQSKITDEYFNIILVDWSDLDSIFYWKAAYKVPLIGQQTAKLMQLIADTFKYNPGDFHIIGHSVGAHIAGTAVRSFGSTEPVITGLDPAGPLFFPGNPLRLDATVCRNVRIMYTCGNYLSISDNAGHTNIYPSGGKWPQPGCGMDIRGVCSHCRSHILLAEMVLNKGIEVTKCDNFQDFKNGKCGNQEKEIFNLLFPSETKPGNFYFWSNASPPFAPTSTISVSKEWNDMAMTVGC